MSGRGKKPAAPKKKANGYNMPAPIANGEVIHDTLMKKKWRIGPSIGAGGFGEIYSACDAGADGSPKKAANYQYVIKIEPHENGPLFVEKHFYVRNANKDDIANYMKTNKLTSLGMPTYFGNGSHVYKGVKYRYLVLERYGKDIWTLFKDAGRSFPPATVFLMGLQMLDVLEYIHSRGYVHADIKGANILLGLKKGTENQAYLVDFGLASRVNSDKEFKPDPKCAHNGTIEYTSRDAHLGVSTMRGDLEILGYNMLQWIVGELPWEKSLKQPKTVQDMKETFFKNVRSNITKLSSHVPDELIKFFEYINTLKPKGVPDYTKCRKLFESYLKSQGKTRTSKLDFTPTKKGKPKHTVVNESDEEEKPKKKSPKQNGDAPKPKRGRKPAKEPSLESDNENEEPDSSSQASIEKVVKRKPRGRKPAREPSTESDNENEEPNSSQESIEKKVVQWKPKGRKPIREPSAESDNENEEPDSSNQDSVKEKVVKRKNSKRKSSEPAVLAKVKKTKLAPKATPPAKKNHANTATQTSAERPKRSPRQVSFDSPICEIIGEKKPFKASKDNESANSSGDIFEDSFVIEEKKVKPKKRLLSDEEITIKRVVRKKVTTVKPKAKSWKDTATILNGRSPPK